MHITAHDPPPPPPRARHALTQGCAICMASHTSLPIRGTIHRSVSRRRLWRFRCCSKSAARLTKKRLRCLSRSLRRGAPCSGSLKRWSCATSPPGSLARYLCRAGSAVRTPPLEPGTVAPPHTYHCRSADPCLPLLCPASDRRLYLLFHPLAPIDVWLKGPGNLKQLITEWYKAHPAFAGSVEWCKRVKNTDPQDNSGQQCYKFCFEYTPNGARAPNARK